MGQTLPRRWWSAGGVRVPTAAHAALGHPGGMIVALLLGGADRRQAHLALPDRAHIEPDREAVDGAYRQQLAEAEVEEAIALHQKRIRVVAPSPIRDGYPLRPGGRRRVCPRVPRSVVLRPGRPAGRYLARRRPHVRRRLPLVDARPTPGAPCE